jgi:Pro-kumamolisin, activation domain
MRHIIVCACACVRAFGLRNSVFFAALLTSLLMGSATEAQIAVGLSRPMVTQPINEGNLVALPGNTRAEARVAANDQGALTDDTPMPHMMLQLRRPAAQEDAFNALIDQLHDPASPNYHHWLTAAEIGERFGPAPSDIRAVTGWLSQHGFAVNTAYTNRMVIDFSGTAGQVRTAFHTEIHNLTVNGVAHFANTTDPQIPAALAQVVVGIVSLHDFRPVPQLVQRPTAAPYNAGTNYYMTPGDLATIYNFKPLFARGAYGSGTIYVIETSTLYTLSDWVYFRDVFQLPSNLGINQSISSCTAFLTRGIRHDSIRHESR